MGFSFQEAGLGDVKIMRSDTYQDRRGYLAESYNRDKFAENGIEEDFVHEFFSRSRKNVLRGLHFQSGNAAQSKIVVCLSGKISDVAADIRYNSDSFGKYTSAELGEGDAVYIPTGFAHGFLTISEEALVYYKTDQNRNPDKEEGVLWSDSELDIEWGIKNPLLSEKDQKWPTLDEIDKEKLKFKDG